MSRLWIVAALAAAPFVVMAGLGRMFYLVDIFSEHYPYQTIVNRVLAADPAGMPLWNPFLFCGMPLLGDPQTQVCYPPAILYRFLPFSVAYNLYIAVHQALAATGMGAFLLFRGLGILPAALGALGYGLGAHAFMLMANAWTLACYAWMPWIGFAASIASYGDRRGGATFLALTIAWLAAAGQPQYVFYGIVLATVLIYQEVGLLKPTKLLRLTGAGALAAACAAILILPAASSIFGSDRVSGLSPYSFRLDTLSYEKLLAYLAPFLFIDVFGRWLVEVRSLWAGYHFVGTFPLVFAVLALMRGGTEIRKVVFVVLLGLVLATVPRIPVLGELSRHTPPFSHIRHSALWLCLTDLGLCWLGALGMHGMINRPSGRGITIGMAATWGMISAACIGFALLGRLPVYWMTRFIVTFNTDLPFRATAFFHPAAVVGLGALVLLFVRRKTIPANRAAIGFIAFTYVELLAVGFTAQPSIKADWLMGTTKVEEVLSGGGEKGGDWYRIYLNPSGFMKLAIRGRTLKEAAGRMRASLGGNLSAASGLRVLGGQNPLMPRRAGDRLKEMVTVESPWKNPAKERLERLGVRYVFSKEPVPGGLEPVYENGREYVYRLLRSRPPVAVEPESKGEVEEWREVRPGRWRIGVRLRQPASVVVAENGIPGWRAYDEADGRRLALGSWRDLLSVPLPAGRHNVVLVYDPVPARLGLFASVGALGALILGGLLGLARCWKREGLIWPAL